MKVRPEKSFRESRHVGACALTERRSSPKGERVFSLNGQRIAEIERVLAFRFPEGVPPTDDLDLWAEPVADHLAAADRLLGLRPNAEALARRLRTLCPDALDERLLAIAAQSCSRVKRWRAGELGFALALTRAERTLLGLRTIRSIDAPTTAEMRAERRSRRAAAERQRRRKSGVGPRIPPSETNATIAGRLGVSVRQVQRLRKAGKLGCHARVATNYTDAFSGHGGVTSGYGDGAAGLRAPARPDPDAVAGFRRIVERVGEIAASTRQIADRVDQALAPVRLVVHCVSGGR